MAISTLQGQNKWVELASSSPTSGSTVTFSSLTQYKNYKISYFNVDTSSASVIFTLRFNNDSGSNYAFVNNANQGGVSGSGVQTFIELNRSSQNDNTGEIFIQDANELIKDITFWHSSSTAVNEGYAYWNSQSVIDRIDLILTNATFSSGTIKVYGRN